VALAILATAFAYILFFELIASAGASNAALVTLVVPVSAVILGTVLLGERLDTWELAGMAVILASLVVIDGRLVSRR
jgi:drug/metabolite transporter (DMT)-like permease